MDPEHFKQYLLILGHMIFFFVIQFLARKLFTPPDAIFQETNSKKRKIMISEFYAYFSSLIHSSAFFVVALSALTSNEPRWTEPNTAFHQHFLCFSIGYFLSDSILGFVFKYNDHMMHLHHYVALSVLLNAFITNRYAFAVVYSIGIGEMSGPFMCLRKILEHNSNRKTEAKIAGIVFCLVFLSFRVLFIHLNSDELFSKRLTLCIKFGFIVGCILIRVYLSGLVFHGS